MTASTAGSRARSTDANVTVDSGIAVTISPQQVTLIPGQTQSFLAEVTGDETTVNWSASCGTIDSSEFTAIYTAPESGEQCTVTATSETDINASGSAVVTLLPPPLTLVVDTQLAEGTTVTLPLRGEVDVTVDWGDGTIQRAQTEGNLEHSYAEEGRYTILISGILTQFGDFFYDNSAKLTEVSSWGNLGLQSLSGAFSGATNLSALPNQLPETVTDISLLFFFATNFNVDISGWDVSRVTNMSFTFYEANAFNQDLSLWDVSGVTDMSGMFYGTTVFNHDISGWDVSSVTTMKAMFERATAFNQDISGWNVSGVTTMAGMFERAEAFNQPIGNWDVSSVTTMERMFERASAFDQDISSWNVSNITTMERMFEETGAFNQDISNWDVSQVTNMDYMFFRAAAFNQDLSGWCVSTIAEVPTSFDDEADAWTLPRPTWGSCSD